MKIFIYLIIHLDLSMYYFIQLNYLIKIIYW